MSTTPTPTIRRRRSRSTGPAPSLCLVPTKLQSANAYVAEHHRHHRPARGCIGVVGVCDGDRRCGVAVIGRPVARLLQDGFTAEVTRCCTDGTRDACSMLYRAAWRFGQGARLPAACDLHAARGGRHVAARCGLHERRRGRRRALASPALRAPAGRLASDGAEAALGDRRGRARRGAMTGCFRFRVRLSIRFRVRLRVRLRVPAPGARSAAFPCNCAAFWATAPFENSVSASDSASPRLLTGGSWRLALRPSAEPLPLPLACPAVARRWPFPPVGVLVTCRCRPVVPLAYRVVAGRRRPRAGLARRSPAHAFAVLPALAVRCCAAPPPLSRRLAGRWCNGRRRAAPPRAAGGAL